MGELVLAARAATLHYLGIFAVEAEAGLTGIHPVQQLGQTAVAVVIIVPVVAVVVTLPTTAGAAAAQVVAAVTILEQVDLAIVGLYISPVFQTDLHFMLQTV
jgi:hypothetical protein